MVNESKARGLCTIDHDLFELMCVVLYVSGRQNDCCSKLSEMMVKAPRDLNLMGIYNMFAGAIGERPRFVVESIKNLPRRFNITS